MQCPRPVENQFHNDSLCLAQTVKSDRLLANRKTATRRSFQIGIVGQTGASDYANDCSRSEPRSGRICGDLREWAGLHSQTTNPSAWDRLESVAITQ